MLSGAATVGQLRSNAAARPPRTDEDRLATIAVDAAAYWAERARRDWA